MEALTEVEASVTEPAMMISTVSELVSAKTETGSTQTEAVTAKAAMMEAPMVETATSSEADLLYVRLARLKGRRVAQRERGSLSRCR